MTWGFAGRAGSRHGPVLNVLLLQETSGNSQSTSTRETGAKNGNWDSGIAANTGWAAARRHRAARGALPVDHRHGVRRRDRGIDPGASEIAVFLVLGVFFVVHAGSHNTLSVFGTGHTPNGYKGLTGVIAGSVYTVLAFGGFEGAAPLAEETRDPRRTVQRPCCSPRSASASCTCSPPTPRPWPSGRTSSRCPGATCPRRHSAAFTTSCGSSPRASSLPRRYPWGGATS